MIIFTQFNGLIVFMQHRPIVYVQHRPIVYVQHRPIVYVQHRPIVYVQHRPISLNSFILIIRKPLFQTLSSFNQ